MAGQDTTHTSYNSGSEGLAGEWQTYILLLAEMIGQAGAERVAQSLMSDGTKTIEIRQHIHQISGDRGRTF